MVHPTDKQPWESLQISYHIGFFLFWERTSEIAFRILLEEELTSFDIRHKHFPSCNVKHMGLGFCGVFFLIRKLFLSLLSIYK